MSRRRLQLGLIDNALDYLLSAAEGAAKGDARDLKYAVLHVAAGVELTMKARLEAEHWSLLFADVNEAAETKLLSGDFRSVDFDTTRTRLEKIAGISLEPRRLRVLRNLRILRNQIQHFTVDVELEQVRAILADSLDFAVDLLGNHLPKDVWHDREDAMRSLYGHLLGFRQFVRARLDTIEPELIGSPEDRTDCPRCWQWTLAVGLGELKCPFCGYVTNAEELAADKHEGMSLEEMGRCPDCGRMTVCFILGTNEDGFDFCTSCGYKKQTVGGD